MIKELQMKRLSVRAAMTASTTLLVLLIGDNTLANETRASRHIYGKEAPEAQVLDAHLLVGEHPSPVFVNIISGGWRSTPPERPLPGLYDAYHASGFSVIAVCHRTVDEHVSWPSPADDVARAIQFIRLHATDWNIDPERISIMGRSSGGHVAMMVGFGKDRADADSEDPVSQQSSAVRCVVEHGGPTDLSIHMRALFSEQKLAAERVEYLRGRTQALLGVEADQVGTEAFYRRLDEISPIRLVNKNTVPVLMLYAGPEGVTSRDDPRLEWAVHTPISGFILAARLKQLDVKHELVIAPNLGRTSPRALKAHFAFLKKFNDLP